MTLPRGRGHADGRHDQVVNYRHVIHSLRKKPMALLNLVYVTSIARLPERQACKIMVELLALAHDRGCERDLAEQLAETLNAGEVPDIADRTGRSRLDLPVTALCESVPDRRAIGRHYIRHRRRRFCLYCRCPGCLVAAGCRIRLSR